MVCLRTLIMKCCVKPLRYSICLVACLTVSGCNNTTTSFLSPKQWPLLHLVQLLSQNIIKVDSSPSLVNQHAALETVSAGSLNSTLIEQPFKHEYAFAVQLASVQSKPLLAYSVKKMTKRAPNIFQGEPILNIETATVEQHTFYRLKYGGYKYFKNAQADCEAIKRQGIDCFVSKYTDNRVYF
ncbi:MAG TPA: hypothetical protein DG048_02040 [Pseudoalteromonas sp.]|nr:hypothetical protein [Pseudoalteromonas sp.]